MSYGLQGLLQSLLSVVTLDDDSVIALCYTYIMVARAVATLCYCCISTLACSLYTWKICCCWILWVWSSSPVTAAGNLYYCLQFVVLYWSTMVSSGLLCIWSASTRLGLAMGGCPWHVWSPSGRGLPPNSWTYFMFKHPFHRSSFKSYVQGTCPACYSSPSFDHHSMLWFWVGCSCYLLGQCCCCFDKYNPHV